MSQGGVSSPGVVEALDVLEDRTSRYVPSRQRVAVDQLPLERANEALGHRVVVGIGHRSYRGQKALFPEPVPELQLHGGVLAAPIGVVNQPRRWPASVDGHVHGIENQFRPKVVRHGPSYDSPSRVSVEHKREVEPAFPGSDVSDVRDPQAIQSLRGEVAFHKIRGRGSALGLQAQSRTSLPSVTATAEQPGLPHQPRHSFPGASNAQRPQLEVNPRRPIGLSAVCVNTNDLLRKQGICLSPSRRCSVPPAVEAALGDSQHPAHPTDPVVCLLRLDEGVDHLRARRFSSLAKNHAAFFSISRSSLSIFTSLRRRLSSSFSSVVSPSRSPASTSAWLTHLRSVSAETSRSRAIFATGYRSSLERTSRMASSLNSGE